MGIRKILKKIFPPPHVHTWDKSRIIRFNMSGTTAEFHPCTDPKCKVLEPTADEMDSWTRPYKNLNQKKF